MHVLEEMEGKGPRPVEEKGIALLRLDQVASLQADLRATRLARRTELEMRAGTRLDELIRDMSRTWIDQAQAAAAAVQTANARAKRQVRRSRFIGAPIPFACQRLSRRGQPGRAPVRGDRADFCVASTFKWLNSIHGAAILTVGDRALKQDVRGPAGWFSAESCYADDRLERFHPRNDAGRYQSGMPNFDSVYALAAALEYHTPERVAARRTALEPLVATLRDGLAKLGLTVLTPPAAADRAGIVAFACPTAADAKRHLAERGIHVHGDDGRLRAAVHWYNTAEHVAHYLAALREVLP